MDVTGEEIEGKVESGRKGKELNQYQESVAGEYEGGDDDVGLCWGPEYQ